MRGAFVMKKICTKCLILKPLEEFPIRKEIKDGRHSHCKDCRNKYHRKYNKTDNAKIRMLKFRQSIKGKKHHREYEKKRRKTEIAKQKYKEYTQTEEYKISHKLQNKKRRLQKKGLRITKIIKQQILNQFNGQCYYCKKIININNVILDHYIPLAKNGKHEIKNLVASCAKCNANKGAKLPEEFIEFRKENYG